MRIWSDVEYVYRCLADTRRTNAFEAAIQATVKPGDVVVDLGTGSGIMALFAMRAGARRVYAVEIGDYLSQSARRTFRDNGFESGIVSLQMDARNLTLSDVEMPDVVICEMITTGLIGEMQGPVINALRRSGVIGKRTKLIPSYLRLKASLVHVDYGFSGFQLRFPIFIDYFSGRFERPMENLSTFADLCSVEFGEPFNEAIQARAIYSIIGAGTINGLRLESTTGLAANTSLADSTSYCQPVIVPLDPLEVNVGDLVSLSLNYTMGRGFDDLNCDLKIQG